MYCALARLKWRCRQWKPTWKQGIRLISVTVFFRCFFLLLHCFRYFVLSRCQSQSQIITCPTLSKAFKIRTNRWFVFSSQCFIGTKYSETSFHQNFILLDLVCFIWNSFCLKSTFENSKTKTAQNAGKNQTIFLAMRK